MKLSLVLSCGLLLSSALVAQGGGVRLSTDTVVGVFATDGPLVDLKLLAANTAIPNPVQVAATVAQARASTSASPTLPVGLGVRISESGSVGRNGPGSDPTAGTTTAQLPAAISPAPHAFLARFGGAMQGRIIITLTGDATAGSRAGASVDVGNDGSVEFSGSVDGTTQVLAVPVNAAAGVAVRIATSGYADARGAQASSNYRADVTVAFQADSACEITPYGQGCGPQLGGADQLQGSEHVFTFRISGAFPSAPISLIFGDRRINFPIPGTSCPLLANPLALVNIVADANGDAVTIVRTPGPLSGVATMQALPFRAAAGGGLRVRSSNGLAIDCDR